MSLSRAQMIQLYLSGTVMFPTNFPALATLAIQPTGINFDGVLPAPPASVPTLTITEGNGVVRHVLLKDVNAVFIPNDVNNVDSSQGTWILGPEIQDLSNATINLAHAIAVAAAANNSNGKGLVFIPEDAPILNALGVDIGATAADSAQTTRSTCCPCF